MVKQTVAGACVVCGLAIVPPASGVIGADGPGLPLISAAPSAEHEGPHVPESPFTVHLPRPEYGGTAATIRLPDSGAALDGLQVHKSP